MVAVIMSSTDTVHEGADFGWTLAFVPGQDGMALRIVDVDTVAVYVYDQSIPSDPAIYFDTSIVPGTVFFDTLVDDRRWQQPDKGYNFRHYLDAPTVFGSVDEVGGHTYRIEYRIQTTPTNASGLLSVVRHVVVYPMKSPNS